MNELNEAARLLTPNEHIVVAARLADQIWDMATITTSICRKGVTGRLIEIVIPQPDTNSMQADRVADIASACAFMLAWLGGGQRIETGRRPHVDDVLRNVASVLSSLPQSARSHAAPLATAAIIVAKAVRRAANEPMLELVT